MLCRTQIYDFMQRLVSVGLRLKAIGTWIWARVWLWAMIAGGRSCGTLWSLRRGYL